jgi:sugar phosphate isomerase/epimerase
MTAWRLDWRELARLAVATGYRGIDMPRNSAIGGDPDEVQEFLTSVGIRPSVYPLPVEYRTSQETFESGFAIMMGSAVFAARIGCAGMTTWLPASTIWQKPEAWKILRSRLAACAELLDGHGLRLGIEFLGTLPLRRKNAYEFVWRMAETLEFARECGPNTGVVLDSWHWHHSGASARDIVAAGAAAIVHVHAADAADIAPVDVDDMERLMPGTGIVEFGEFFGALRLVGYEGGVSPEVFNSRLKEITPEQGAREGAECLRKVMNC